MILSNATIQTNYYYLEERARLRLEHPATMYFRYLELMPTLFKVVSRWSRIARIDKCAECILK